MVSTIIKQGKLVFRLVNYSELKEKKRYLIRYMKNMYYFDAVLVSKERLLFTKGILTNLYYYYELVAQTPAIQLAMEQRSLTTILRTITGDETFKY